MAVRVRLLLAGAAAVLAVAGCGTSATEDKRAEAPTPAGTADAAISEAQKKEAQRLAEDAEKIMLDPALAPKEKYPKALGMFRDALKIDPDNALAARSVTLIEDIYKSMGRPVPPPT